jgi:4-amino-4-deoxy-L-arabinose transferase-like glycosyltransferase
MRDLRLDTRTAGFLLVLLAAVAFRTVDLGHNQPGFWQDEASTGIDAWTLWKTGRDRAGAIMPIISASFGDYPLALYRYLDAPIVGLFGMTPTHERLPAVIFGLLLLPAVWLLADLAFGRTAAVGALLSAALCPTLILFSRYGSEAILLTFTLTLGWLFVEIGRDPKRRWGLYGAAFSFAASTYTYHAVKVLLPIWMFGFVIYLWPLITELWRHERERVVVPVLIFFFGALPSVLTALTPEGMSRGKVVMAWNQHHGLNLAWVIALNYTSYFDPDMLFRRGGDSAAQSFVGLGVLNAIDLPLIVAGLLSIVLARGERARASGFLLYWFLVGPLPGGLGYEPRNVGRAMGWFPAPELLAGVGFAAIVARVEEGMRQPAARRLAAGVGALLLAVTTIYVGWSALIRYPEETKRDWQWEVSSSMECARKVRKNERVIVSPEFPFPTLFASYFFSDLRIPGEGERPAFAVETRSEVRPGELYVFPRQVQKPKGKLLCDLAYRGDSKSFVYGATPPPAPVRPARTTTATPPAVD